MLSLGEMGRREHESQVTFCIFHSLTERFSRHNTYKSKKNMADLPRSGGPFNRNDLSMHLRRTCELGLNGMKLRN